VHGIGQAHGGFNDTLAYAVNRNALGALDMVIVSGSEFGSGGRSADRYTVLTGYQDLGNLGGRAPGFIETYSEARALSADASVIVGYSRAPDGMRAFKWTAATGMSALPDLPGGAVDSGALAVSANGSITGGWSTSTEGPQAMLWFPPISIGGITVFDGLVELGDLPGGAYDSAVHAMSGDGAVAVGAGNGNNGREAFIWSNGQGMRPLGQFFSSTTPDSVAYCVSDDGTVVGGTSRTGAGTFDQLAFVWRDDFGMVPLQDILTYYGVDMTGWSRFLEVTGITPDGRTLVGNGVQDLDFTGFRVTLPENFMPEPGAVLPVALAGLALLRRRRRRGGS
jgi:probable HAF family extracellular repeat protein